MLLKSGAKLTVPAFDEQLPIHLAAIHGHVKITQMLLDKTSAVDVRDGQGNTALHYAVTGGHPEIARLLLKRHADPTA